MRTTKTKDVYVSPYTTEIVDIDGKKIVVQYLPSENKHDAINARKVVLSRRGNDDLKMTDYFAKRSKNLVDKIYACKNGDELVELLVKNTGVTFSGHFLYRDVIDIITAKQPNLTFSQENEEIFKLIVISLKLNNVIAPKIKAVYQLTFGVSDEDAAE